ncbi:hypothetical protein FQN55_002316 [Onygenales sp. PD_40]|nr:hypothetical protein FQN55_002316 [Onygenales sp. PD_40]KAK2781901.1 hypothetical protein FQN52_001301 [Onygenales sp. PD_12]
MTRALQYNRDEERKQAKSTVTLDRSSHEFSELRGVYLNLIAARHHLEAATETAVNTHLQPKSQKYEIPFPWAERLDPKRWEDAILLFKAMDNEEATCFFYAFLAAREEQRRQVNASARIDYREAKQALALQERDANIPLRQLKRTTSNDPNNDEETSDEEDVEDQDQDDDDRYIDTLVDNVKDDDLIQVFLDDDVAESEAAATSTTCISMVRQQFIQNWLRKKDIHTGRQTCPLCAINGKIQSCQSIAILSRHMESAIHVNLYLETFLDACRQDLNKIFTCRVCGMQANHRQRFRNRHSHCPK